MVVGVWWTVTVAIPLTPSRMALIVPVPFETAVAIPAEFTVKMAGESVVQATVPANAFPY